MIPGTWQHVLIAAGLIAISLGFLAVALEKPVRRWLASRRRLQRRQATPKPDGALTPWPLKDYTAARLRQIEWLGSDYLLSQPVERRSPR